MITYPKVTNRVPLHTKLTNTSKRKTDYVIPTL